MRYFAEVTDSKQNITARSEGATLSQAVCGAVQTLYETTDHAEERQKALEAEKREASLAEERMHLARERDRLAMHDAELAAREEDLVASAEDLHEREAELVERGAALAKREKAFDSTTEGIAADLRDLVDENTRLNGLVMELETYKRLYKGQGDELRRKSRQVDNLQDKLKAAATVNEDLRSTCQTRGLRNGVLVRENAELAEKLKNAFNEANARAEANEKAAEEISQAIATGFRDQQRRARIGVNVYVHRDDEGHNTYVQYGTGCLTIPDQLEVEIEAVKELLLALAVPDPANARRFRHLAEIVETWNEYHRVRDHVKDERRKHADLARKLAKFGVDWPHDAIRLGIRRAF